MTNSKESISGGQFSIIYPTTQEIGMVACRLRSSGISGIVSDETNSELMGIIKSSSDQLAKPADLDVSRRYALAKVLHLAQNPDNMQDFVELMSPDSPQVRVVKSIRDFIVSTNPDGQPPLETLSNAFTPDTETRRVMIDQRTRAIVPVNA